MPNDGALLMRQTNALAPLNKWPLWIKVIFVTKEAKFLVFANHPRLFLAICTKLSIFEHTQIRAFHTMQTQVSFPYKSYDSMGAPRQLIGITLDSEHWYAEPWTVCLRLSDNNSLFPNKIRSRPIYHQAAQMAKYESVCWVKVYVLCLKTATY